MYDSLVLPAAGKKLPFTYNWPVLWNGEKVSSVTGDSRWQYDNIWLPFLQTLTAPHYRRPELDFAAPRRQYILPYSLSTAQWAHDLKEDYEGYGNKARFVDYLTKQPFSTLNSAYIDRYTGLMSTYNNTGTGIAANNNYDTIVGLAMSSTAFGFDDWLPWTFEIWCAINNSREGIANSPVFQIDFGWLATNGSSTSVALIDGGGYNLGQQAKTGGTARTIRIYRKYF